MNIVTMTALYGIRDILRSRWGIVLTLFLFLLTTLLFQLSGDSSRVFVSLLNIILFLIPLIAITFGSMYLYNSREFIELLLTQPVKRSSVYAGLYFGLISSLSVSLLLGVGVPIVLHSYSVLDMAVDYVHLILTGMGLVCIFVGLAFWLALLFEDKSRGLGSSLLIWFLSAVVYDGLILILISLFADYPLEQPLIIVSLLNPIDLARIMLLLRVDIAALMGYTGAVFERFFGSYWGIVLTSSSLIVWITWPFIVGLRLFTRRDF